MNKAVPQHERKDLGRLPHKIPVPLIEEIDTKCDKHLPRPQKKAFIEMILMMGMDAYEEERDLTAPLVGRPENPDEDVEIARLNHYFSILVVERFNKIHEAHRPVAVAKSFYEFIINLGIQAYEREYTIYGFKRERKRK